MHRTAENERYSKKDREELNMRMAEKMQRKRWI
jgi:hypothetical protein